MFFTKNTFNTPEVNTKSTRLTTDCFSPKQTAIEIGIRYFFGFMELATEATTTSGNLSGSIVFHNLHDPKLGVSNAKKAVAGLKAFGGKVHLTILDQGGHDSWTKAIRDYDVIGWMLMQTRYRSSWVAPPGVCPWRVYFNAALPYLADPKDVVPPGLIGFIIWSAWRIQRFRRRRSVSRASRAPS